MTEQDYDAITMLNQRAAFFVAQAVARRMVQASVRGSIIHISSQMGHVGGARRTVYCMSKHGIEGLTKAMAIDLAPHGIRVNSIGPTFIDTPLTRPFWNDRAFHDDVVLRAIAWCFAPTLTKWLRRYRTDHNRQAPAADRRGSEIAGCLQLSGFAQNLTYRA